MTKLYPIKLNDDGEFEVPTDGAKFPASSFAAGLYFTDDRQDALDTYANAHPQADSVRVVRGTYQEA